MKRGACGGSKASILTIGIVVRVISQTAGSGGVVCAPRGLCAGNGRLRGSVLRESGLGLRICLIGICRLNRCGHCEIARDGRRGRRRSGSGIHRHRRLSRLRLRRVCRRLGIRIGINIVSRFHAHRIREIDADGFQRRFVGRSVVPNGFFSDNVIETDSLVLVGVKHLENQSDIQAVGQFGRRIVDLGAGTVLVSLCDDGQIPTLAVNVEAENVMLVHVEPVLDELFGGGHDAVCGGDDLRLGQRNGSVWHGGGEAGTVFALLFDAVGESLAGVLGRYMRELYFTSDESHFARRQTVDVDCVGHCG